MGCGSRKKEGLSQTLDDSASALESVVSMGRTLATFTQLVQQEIDSWSRYRRALRHEDQQALDVLFAAARHHASAGAYLARETPFEVMLLSMLIEQQKYVVALQQKVMTLETRSAPRLDSRDGFLMCTRHKRAWSFGSSARTVAASGPSIPSCRRAIWRLHRPSASRCSDYSAVLPVVSAPERWNDMNSARLVRFRSWKSRFMLPRSSRPSPNS